MCELCGNDSDEHPPGCCNYANLVRMALGGEVLDRFRDAPTKIICNYCGHETDVREKTSFRCECNRNYYLVDNGFDTPYWKVEPDQFSS